MPIALAALDSGRLGIAACATGLAQAALDCAVDVRPRSGSSSVSSIAEFQGIQFLLAEMAAAVDTARATYLMAARRRDAGRPFTRDAAVAKLTATDTAMRVTTDAVQVLGGYGYTQGLPGRALPAGGQGHPDLRGHQPDPAAGHRPPTAALRVMGA